MIVSDSFSKNLAKTSSTTFSAVNLIRDTIQFYNQPTTILRGPSHENNTRTIHVTPSNSNNDPKGSKTMKTTSAKFIGGDKILKLRVASTRPHKNVSFLQVFRPQHHLL